MRFKIIKIDKKSDARLGVLKTSHGEVSTPCFMPCATHGAIKTVGPEELKALGVEILLGNTYHLYLRPGENPIKKMGGLHKFMNWDKPILTDSGGYQVFSLSRKESRISNLKCQNLVKITEDGVWFRSHHDGSRHFFSPEKVIDIQRNLESDIMMVLDECAPYPCSKKYAKEAMERTHFWAVKSLRAFENKKYGNPSIPSVRSSGANYSSNAAEKYTNSALFGIIQGSVYKDLRKNSAKFITSLPFDGIAIGGVSVGEGKKEMYQVLDWVMPIINKSETQNQKSLINFKSEIQDSRSLEIKNLGSGFETRPVYLMGVGEPQDLLEAVERGVDMFDCVLPTRLARHGAVWVSSTETKPRVAPAAGISTRHLGGKRINLLNSQYRADPRPIMPGCRCYACSGNTHLREGKGFSRAYIRHLLQENETFGIRLCTIHNLHFILNLMADIRRAIKNNKFSEFKKNFLRSW